MRTLRRHRAPIGVLLTLVLALWQIASPFSASAATYYWDIDGATPGAGGTVVSGTWNVGTANWSTDSTGSSATAGWANTGSDTAVFSAGTDATGTSTVTLNQGGAINVGSIVVEDGSVVLSGNTAADTLDFSGAVGDVGIVNVGFGSSLTINSEITGTSGLGKVGNGTLVLTNNANSYTGQTTVNAGTLVVTNQGQLGTSTSTVSVGGVSGFGFTGGTLWLQGGINGMDFDRNISLSGRGPNTVGAALVLSGNDNVLNGSIGFTNTTESRVVSIYGTSTLNGRVQVASGTSSLFGGGGNVVVNGQVVGGNEAQDRLIKFSGILASTMVLNNNSNTFLGGIRIDGSASVRVAQNGALGNSTLIQALDMNGGLLEVRTDAPDFSSRNVRIRGNTNTIYVDRAVGGSGFDQTVAFGNLRMDANSVMNVIGRNGYDVTFTGPSGVIPWINGNPTTISNLGNGLLTINASIERASETTARTLTFGGNGDILMTGDVRQLGTGAVSLTKTGQGTFWLQGTASTATGTTLINQGTLAINRFGGLTTGQLNIGNATTTAGILQYLGEAGTGAGEITTKNILLNTTTGNVVILADQTGSATSALVLNGSILGTVGGAADTKTLYLGGVNADDNEVRSVLPATAGTLNLAKVGSGTWMLSNANLYTGSTTIANGHLKLLATDANTLAGVSNVIGGGAVIFNTDALTNRQTAGGLLEYIGHAGGPSTETLGALTATAGAGTVQVTHGGGATALVLGSLGTVAAGTGVNFVVGDVADSISITGSSGFLNAHLYYNGADFAFSDAGLLRAPVYGTDAGFVTSASALTAASHNEITGSFNTLGMTISSLKISGDQTLTLDPSETLTIQTAANSAGGILVTGGDAVITGGTGITTGGSGDMVIRVNGASDSLTLTSLITSSTTGGLTKNGAGSLFLEGLQAYTGTTTINEGSIVLQSGGRLGGSVNNNLVVRQDGTLDLNGISVGVGAFNGAGLVTNTSGTAATLTIGNNNQSGLYSGLITGNLGVTKVGTGTTMSLTGLNTYTGVTTISGGVLVVNNLTDIGENSSIGTGDDTSDATNAASLVFNGGTLQYTGANGQIFQQTNTPSVSIDRLFTLAGNGTIDSSGTFGNSALGASSNHASLIFNNTADVAFSGAGNRTLTLTGSSVGWNEMHLHLVDNPNGGLLNVTKSGAGLWILAPSSANTYTGITTVTGGALQAVDGVGLSAQSNLLLNGGVFQTSGTFTRSLGTGPGQVQFTTGSGGFAAGETGRLVVSIGGVGTPTNLVWGTGGFFTTGSTMILGSTSSLWDVEVVNNIDLGGATRTITTENNGNTHMDFATLSGVISGTGGINKNGSNYLVLGDNNTYTGNTLIDNGTLVVTSVGAAGDTATSLGTNVGGGVLNMGAGGNTVNLLYTGSGETVTRTINLIGTTGTAQFDSSGTGALIITNLNHTGSGAKTLGLRGYNMDFNEITANLVDNGGILSVTKSDGGNWILSGNNTFTGNLTINSGFIGATAGTALGSSVTGSIVFSNGGLFAHGGDITVNRNSTIAVFASAVFTGDHSITLNGTVSRGTGNGDITIVNSIAAGETLTLNGNFNNAEQTNNRSVLIRGTGHTIWNGVIHNNNGAGAATTALDINHAGILTLEGGSPNTFTGGTNLAQGKLIINKVGALGGGNFNFNGGVLEAGFALTGGSAITNNVVFSSGNVSIVTGTNSIDFNGTVTNSGGDRRLQNDLTGGGILSLNGTVNLSNDGTSRTMLFEGSGNTVINGVIQNSSGAATASALHMRGTGTLTITNQATYGGATTVSNGTLILTGANGRLGGNSTAAVAINPKATVTLDNSTGNSTTANRLNGKPITMTGGTLNLITAAGGSSETMGILTVNSVIGTLGISGAGAGTMTFASVNFANTGSMLDLGGIANLGTTNKVIFTTSTGFLTNGINVRTAIGGTHFASYDNTNGVVAFTGYNVSNNLNTAATTDTMRITADANLTANRTLNALAIDGNGLTVSADNGVRMTLGAAGVLVTGGANTIDMTYLTMSANPVFQVNSGASLNLNAALQGGFGLSKVLDGTMTISTQQFYNSTTNVMGGTLVLNGGLNTIYQNQLLNMGTVGTLDLNGNSQFFAQLSGPGGQPNSSGSITNSSGTHAVLVGNFGPGSGTLGGAITGNLSLARSGGNTFTLEVANTYTGATLLNGGTTTLRDFATLQNTTSIDLNYATLFLANNDNLQIANDNRVNDAAAITMRGGALTYTARANDAGSERFGSLTIAEGANTISSNTGGSQTYHSAAITFADFTRLAGTTVNFTGSTLGFGGDGNAGRIFFDAPPAVAENGALGAWAIANTTDYAAYNTTLGVGAFDSAAFPIYDLDFGTGKVTNLGGTATSALSTNLSADTTTGLLRFASAFTNDITFSSSGTKLNLEMGGILRSNNFALTRIGTAATRGVVTAGGNAASGNTEMVVYNNNTANFTGAAANATIVNTNTLALTSTTGIVPGMVITGPNIPVGTVVTAVNGLNVTLSNNATATANAGTFTFYSTVEMNSVIVDTSTAIGSGTGTVSLVKSGGGALVLTAENTYTGGTTLNQGQVVLMGGAGTVVLPSGGLTLNSAVLSMAANSGQIHSSNLVTLNGSSTLNLLGNNTLAGIVFNNNGGTGTPTLNTNGILTLSDANAITATSTNVATTATINGYIDLGSGVKVFDIEGIKPFGQIVSTISPTLVINAVIHGNGATINKTGDGLLQLGGQSTFTGGLNIQGGGLIIAASGNLGNAPSVIGGPMYGPLGSGTVTMAAGTKLLSANNSPVISNAFVFQGNPIFDNTGLSTVTLTLNGDITLPNGNVVVDVIAPNFTAALAGKLTNAAGITSITKVGLGNLSLNLDDYSGPINFQDGGTFGLLMDGDGTGGFQTLDYDGTITINGFPSFVVGRAGGGEFYKQALNKVIRPTDLVANLSDGLTVSALNLYGLLIENDVTLNNGNVFTVSGASNSNTVSALNMAGVLSGAPAGITKTGNGTLVLSNAGNTFGGASGVVAINQGVVSVSSDAALGNASNIIRLNPTTGTSTFRADGTFATSRVIQFGNTANTRAIEVTAGNTLTLNSAFDFSTFSVAAAALVKNDRGTLQLNAANTGWDGVLTINHGVVHITNSAALGSTVGATAINSLVAQLQLSNNVVVGETLNIVGANNQTWGGFDSTGVLRSVSDVNTWSGTINLTTATSADNNNRSALITVDGGSTLNLTGNLTAAMATSGTGRDMWWALGGAGTGNITSQITHSGGSANNFYTLAKFGSGTWNLQAANAFSGHAVYVIDGTLALNGAGTLGVPGTGGSTANAIFLQPKGTILLDSTGTNTSNRLSNRNLDARGGNLTILGSAAGTTTETTTGTVTLNPGALTLTVTPGAGQQANFTAGAVTRNAGSTVLFRGTNLGNAAGADVATIQFTGTGLPAFIGQTGGVGATNKGILPWGIVDTSSTGTGVSFATADSATGRIRALSGSEYVTAIGNASALQNVRLSTAESLQITQVINSLQLDGGGSMTLEAMRTLSLDSGGLLALAGNGGISGGILSTVANRELIVHTAGNLDISSAIAFTTGGLTKSGNGMLTLSSSGNAFSGNINLLQGTLKLSGGDNTIFYNNTLQMQGGTLDLNGSVQHFASVVQSIAAPRNANLTPDTGGIITNTAGTQATLAVRTGGSFAGSIQGNIALVRSTDSAAFGDWNIYTANTFTGPMLLNGGRTQLLGSATFSNTSAIELSQTTLLISNNNGTSITDVNLNDRINDSANILMRGSMFQYRARFGEIGFENIGNVTLAEGASFFDVAEPGTAINESTLTMASLTRQAGSRATLRFINVDGQVGNLAQIFITSAPVLTNNIIGGWAVYEREFASYTTGTGVGALNTAGYAGYSTRTFNDPGLLVSDNVRLATNAAVTTLTSDHNINSLALLHGVNSTVTTVAGSQQATVTGSLIGLYVGQVLTGNANITNGTVITAINGNVVTLSAPALTSATSIGTNFGGSYAMDLGGNTLTLASGGLIASTAIDNSSITIQNGSLTSGTAGNPSDLYLHALSYVNGNTDLINRDVIVNASIVDNGGGAVTLVVNGSEGRAAAGLGTNEVFLNTANTYTGGTYVNAGKLVLNVAGANGTSVTALGTGNLTITGGAATNGSTFQERSTTVQLNASNQIHNSAIVTLLGGATLNLNGFSQTVGGIVFNNTGGNTPTITTGTNGILTLNGNVTATSQNIGNGTISAMTTAGTGYISLGGATRTFDVSAVRFNGEIISPRIATLNVSGVIRGVGNEGIIKTGDGLMQLSAQNTFSGGLNVQNGGIIIAGNSTPTLLASEDQGVQSGPLGTGTVTMASGTRLLVDNTSRTVTNAITFQGNLTFDSTGVNVATMALNGPIVLPGGAVSVDVIAPALTVSLGGPISSTGAVTSLIKEGLGTLALTGNFGALNTSAVVNNGTLELGSVTGPVVSPLTGSITLNGGLLSLRNNGGNGTGGSAVIAYNNDVILGSGVMDHQINVGPLTTGTGGTIQMGKLTTTVNNQGLAVLAASGYNLRFLEKDINTQARFNVTSGSTLTFLTSSDGLSQSVTGPGNIISGGDTLVNSGLGTLVVGVGVKTNTTTNFGGGPLNFAAGNNTYIPLAGTFSAAGYTQGGLMVRQTSFAAGQNANSAANSGVGPAAAFPSLTPPADTAYNNRPPVGVTASLTNSAITYSGLVEITSGGTYGFRFANDDQGALFIDGVMVLGDNVGGGGQAITERGTTFIELSAGFHQIVFIGVNQGSGGGFNLLYSGPDTASNGSPGGFQALDPNKLYYASNLGNVGNNFLNAAIISDTYNLAAAQSSTLDGQGTHFNLMFGALTLGAGSTLTVANQFGTGYYGVVGTTTIGGANTTVNPTTGTLYFAGGVNDGGNGLIKTGAGSLYLGTSTNFTGTFAMNAGFTLLANTNGLSSGSNVVASGAQLDLYGNSSHGNVTLNGTGVALLASGTTAALWNSLANSTGTLTGNVTIGASGTRIGGLGDIVLSGDLSDGAALGFTKIGTNTLTLSGNNVGFTGVASITNGILKLGSDTALGTGGSSGSNTVISSGAVLDLNGATIANEFVSVAGTGFNNRNTTPNTLGAIINSSNAMATFGGPITMTANTSIGSNRLNANSGVATAGDITLTGAVTGAFVLTKVGNNTLHFTGSGSTYNGTAINGGKVVVSGAGHLGTGGNHSIAGYGQPTGIIPFTTLQLDNTGTASNSRLGGRALSMRNGHLILDGHATTAVNESLGTNALTIDLGHSVISLNNNGGDLRLTAGSLVRNGSATLVIRGSGNDIGVDGTTGIFFSGTTPIPVGTENTTAQFNETDASGILPWILIDNGISTPGFGPYTMSFARYDATLGLTNLENYSTTFPSTGVGNGAADLNIGVADDMQLLNGYPLATDINTQSTGINSITFADEPTDKIVTIGDRQILTLDSGGILALSSGSFVGNGSLNVAGNRQFVVHTIGASTVLNVDVEMGGRLAPTTGGLAKTGEGTLILGERNNYTGSTVVNLGTLQLNGGNNTIFYTFTTSPTVTGTGSGPQGQAFAVSPGGIVDLNGNNQTINNLQGNGGQNVAGAGGIVTNTSGTASEFRLVVNGNVNWQGSINGNVNLIKSGGSTTAFYDNNAYTGTTLIQGGVFTLIDQGRLSGTSGITVSRAVLRWDDTGMQQMTNRLGAATPITLNGGALSYLSRGGTNGVMDVGNIHLASGANYINVTPNTGTATIRMGGLTRAANATLTFAAGSGTPGANPFFYFDSAPTLSNGIIGGWAYALGTDTITTGGNIEFATYDESTGVRMLTAAQVVNHFDDPTGNVRFGGNATVKAGGAVINSLTLNGAALTLSFTSGTDVLNIASGGLLGGLDNNQRIIGSIALPGIITAGGVNPASDAYLFVTNPSNNLQINSIIADNPTNGRTVHLVLGSAGRADNTARITLANANTYTGLTYIQGVRVDLANVTGSGNAITGDLILSGGVENQGDSSNPDVARLLNRAHEQIADTANVTVLGGGSWELFGFNETINNLDFQNEGGTRSNVGPRVQTGTALLTLNGNVTATNLANASAISLLAGNVNFGVDNALTVTVDEVAGAKVGTHNQIGLTMNINVVGGGTLTKQGPGMLAMGGQSNSVLQLNVATGDLTLMAGSSYQNTTVNLASGTRLDMRAQTNVVLGNLTGSGTLYNFHHTSAGTLITGGANADATFSGIISSEFTNSLINVTKVGTGTWTLTADNSQELAGTLALLEGGILLNSATARLGFATQNISTGGVLTLDNSANALSFRMGGPVAENSTGIRTSLLDIGSTNVKITIPTGNPNPNRTVNFQGGTINYMGGSSNVAEGFNTITLAGGASTLNMTASSAETIMVTATLSGVNNGVLYFNAIGSGAILGGTKGAGHVNFAATTPNLVGGGGAAGTRTMSIRPDIIGTDSTGTGFVTHDANGLRLLTSAEYKTPDTRYIGTATPVRVTTVAGAAAGDNIGATENVRTSLNHNLDNSTTLNSLTLESGGGISSAAGGMLTGSGQGESVEGVLFNGSGALNMLTVTSGGLLAFTGNTGIQGGAITAGGNRLYITALGDISISSYILGSQSIVKSGAGTLTLGKKTLNTGVLSLHEGTLVLNGGDNTILVAPGAGAATQLDFNLNGGTLNLNGNDQAFGRITTSSGDTAPNGAGDITNTGGLATLFVNTNAGSVTYSGNVSGAINLVKAGANTWTLTGAHSYTGATIVRGGILQLRDDAVLSGTSSIEINYSSLFMDNSGWSGASRLPAGVNVTLRGGNFQFTTRQGTSAITENVGAITFAEGMSRTQFNAVPLGGQMTVNSTGIVHTNGDATWFATPGTGSMGRGNSDSGDQSPQIIVAGGIPLINGIIGGWAIQNGDHWLTYQSTVHSTGATGVGAIFDTGAGFVGYNEDTATVANFTSADSVATRNMRLQNETFTVADIGGVGTAGNFLLNSLATLANGNGDNLVFADSLDTLYLTAGAFLRAGNFTSSIGSAVNNGKITSGVVGATGLQYLYMYNNQNVLTLNSQVVDNNASAAVRLVLWSANGGRFDLVSANLHTGGTVVSGNSNVNTVQLNIANAIPAGGLTINDTTVVTNTAANVVNGVHATNIVTINGGGVLNLTTNVAATNTLAGLVFNNTGSGSSVINNVNVLTTPTVQIGVSGSTLILSGTNAITATNLNYQTLPTIAVTTGGFLEFSASAPVITVNNPSGIATHGLLVNAVIRTNAGWTQALTKDGNGMLSLAAANTFTQGILLKDGGLVLGNAAALGTGKLTVGDGVAGGTHTLMTNGAGALTIANQIDINEDLIIGGTNANAGTGHNLTASGAVALSGGDRVITVESPTVTFNITGAVSNASGGLIKDGDGILQLSNAGNNYTGDTRVKRGLLRQGSATALAGSHLIVESAGTVDMNGNNMTVKSLSGEDALHGGVITNSANNAMTLNVGDVLASVDATFAGIITDNRAVQSSSRINVVKTGDSRQKLTGMNTYGGTTVVNSTTTTLGGGGHLQVGENGIGQTGTGGTTVNAGATLSGSGLINGTPGTTAHAVASGATLSPGDNYGATNGTLTFNGNLTLNAGSQSLFQLTSRTTSTSIGGGFVDVATSLSAELAALDSALVPDGAHDALQINGTLNATGGNATTLFMVQDNSYLVNSSVGDVFDLLDWTGSFNLTTFNAGTNFRTGGDGGGDLFLPTLVNVGQAWDVSAFASHGILVVVPEPSRALLLLGGMLMLLSFRRRRSW